jgi:hypothetical protein
MELNDSRWNDLQGGYGVPYDARPALKDLMQDPEQPEAWETLWHNLYHQGKVGVASYAAVPELVKVRRQTGIGLQTYDLVAAIELARTEKKNPEIPNWLKPGYDAAIYDLAIMGISELRDVTWPDTIRSILAIIAVWKGRRTHARLLLNYSDEELDRMLHDRL